VAKLKTLTPVSISATETQKTQKNETQFCLNRYFRGKIKKPASVSIPATETQKQIEIRVNAFSAAKKTSA